MFLSLKKNTAYQSLWDAVRWRLEEILEEVALGGMAVSTYSEE